MAPNHTNQIFVKVPDAHLEQIQQEFGYSYDCRVDENHSVVRFCTGWATNEVHVEALISMIGSL